MGKFKKIIDITIITITLIAMIIGLIKQDFTLIFLGGQVLVLNELITIKKELAVKKEEKAGCGCKH
jgi:hypothetical protein